MEVGIFHKYINDKIKLLEQNSNTIRLEKVKKMLHQHRMPSALHSKFLEEMKSMGLLKLKNKQNVIINR